MSDLTSVEVLKIDGTHLCTLPSLKAPHYTNSQATLVTCGNRPVSMQSQYNAQLGNTSQVCYTFDTSSGEWNLSHNLKFRCQSHSSWASPNGTILMGGDDEGICRVQVT